MPCSSQTATRSGALARLMSTKTMRGRKLGSLRNARSGCGYEKMGPKPSSTSNLRKAARNVGSSDKIRMLFCKGRIPSYCDWAGDGTRSPSTKGKPDRGSSSEQTPISGNWFQVRLTAVSLTVSPWICAGPWPEAVSPAKQYSDVLSTYYVITILLNCMRTLTSAEVVTNHWRDPWPPNPNAR